MTEWKPNCSTRSKLLLNFPSTITTTTTTPTPIPAAAAKKKKWGRKGKVLQAIIQSTPGNNKYFYASSGIAGDDKIHNGSTDECMEEDQDDRKQYMFKVALPSLARVPSRGLNSLIKLGRAMSMRKESHQQEDKGEELCKKRILMGMKCRPLNISGALHYDKDGVLIPEDILSPSDDD